MTSSRTTSNWSGNWSAIWAFAKLQWRGTRAALRGGGRKAFAAIFTIVFSLALGLVGLVVIPVALRASSPGPNLTAILVGGASLLFLVTMAISTIVGVNNSLDIRVVATEPLTRFQLAVGQLAMESAGPTGIAMMLAGTGVVIGTSGSLAAVPLAISAVVILLIANILVSRVVVTTLGLLVDRSPRIGQFVSGMVGLLFMVGYQVAANVGPRVSGARWRSITDVAGRLPGGSIGRALAAATEGGFGSFDAWLNVAWTAIWIPALIWLFVRFTERLTVASGERSHRLVRDRFGWRRWFGTGPTGAIATRTALTTIRSPRRLIELTMGFVVGAASIIVPPLLTSDTGRAVVVTGFGTCFAVILPLSNMFGTDGPALAHEFLAGATPAEMVAGKRRFAVAAGVPLVVIGPIILAAVTGAWSLWPAYVLVAIAGVLGGSAVAIVQSSWAPVAIPEDVNPFALGGSSGLLAAVTWFASLIGLSVVMAPALVGVALAAWFVGPFAAALAAIIAVGWAYGVARLAETFAGGFVARSDRLLDQVTPA